MPSIIDIIGENLITLGGGEASTARFADEGKIIGLFFTAGWCPPCRAFTPKLVEWHDNFKSSSKGKNLEMVLVSSDRSQEEFDKYVQDLPPWYALPYIGPDDKRKIMLSQKYKVQGIPMLVFVEGSTGELITADGRNCITDDPKGEKFPWYPKSLSAILTGTVQKGSEVVDLETTLEGKIRAFYFSAHWCPPCRAFTPVLVSAYERVRASGRGFEVVFVSSDRSAAGHADHTAGAPFLALPYGDDRCKQLTTHFGVLGIPTLIVLDENNEVITTNGRREVMRDQDAKNFPWYPPAVEELDETSVSVLNDRPSLLLFSDGEAEFVRAARVVMTTVAEEYKVAEKAGKAPQLAFLYEGTECSDELADHIREYADLPDRSPLVCILDVPAQRKFVLPREAAELTEAGLAGLVADYRDGRLAWGPLRAGTIAAV